MFLALKTCWGASSLFIYIFNCSVVTTSHDTEVIPLNNFTWHFDVSFFQTSALFGWSWPVPCHSVTHTFIFNYFHTTLLRNCIQPEYLVSYMYPPIALLAFSLCLQGQTHSSSNYTRYLLKSFLLEHVSGWSNYISVNVKKTMRREGNTKNVKL